jgi:hypothetical protein
MEQWGSIIAAMINTVLVLGIVQLLKTYIPKLKEVTPWLIPILAGAIGPAAAAGQNYLGSLLGAAIYLDPIVAIFTGASATTANQVYKQAKDSKPVEAGKKLIALLLLAGACGLLVSGSLTGCATLGSRWNAATEDEKARLILDDLQTSVDSMLEFGEIYVAIHPEKKPDWQTRVLPLFKAVNEMIGKYIPLAEANAGKVTVWQVLSTIQPKLAEIEAILIKWGFSKK